MDEHESLTHVEELLENGESEEAQKALDAIKEKSGRKYYLQSKIYKGKCWYLEQRKQLKKAVKAEPDNEEYKKELEELEEFSKTPEYKNQLKKQLGGFNEACCLCSCEICGSGCCEALCDGCG